MNIREYALIIFIFESTTLKNSKRQSFCRFFFFFFFFVALLLDGQNTKKKKLGCSALAYSPCLTS